MEGSRPNTRPMTVENATAAAAAGMLITMGMEDILAMTAARRIPAKTPRTPPMLVRTAASVRNWPRILLLLAPMAFFRPISPVRSVTDTSIMI